MPGSTSELAVVDDNTQLGGTVVKGAGLGGEGTLGMEGPFKPSRKPQMWGH